MKTLIGALIGIVVIVLIVVLARMGHKGMDNSSDTQQQTNTQQTAPAQTAQPSTTDLNSVSMTTTQPNGLKITTTKVGTGVAAQTGDTVTVNYTGMLTNGTVFDSNVDPKFNHVQPFQFTLGENRVIQGWEQGVLGMKVGEKRHLVIPAELGYGANGAGALIPPNATLEFDVEVTNITHR